MYVIREGLGEKWKPLAAFFAICGRYRLRPDVSVEPGLTQIVRDMVFGTDLHRTCRAESTFMFDSIVGSHHSGDGFPGNFFGWNPSASAR